MTAGQHNLKVSMELRLDLDVPPGFTPELIASMTGEAAEAMVDAFAVARGVRRAAPVEVKLVGWHLRDADGNFVGRIG